VSEREREKNHMEGVVFEIKESKYKQYLIPFFVIQKHYRRSILKREISIVHSSNNRYKDLVEE
jgi:hypothetical protein